ncbi:hypothetical protein PENSPDRAFT_695036 [Peniophora sp. CONT]|nr:hypothetical protein PENSPDRAFT_695036 [Peniophora sp. CONT]
MPAVRYEEFTLRAVDKRNATSSNPDPSSSFREPPPSSSPTSTSSTSSLDLAASSAPTSEDVRVPDVKLPHGQLGIQNMVVSQGRPPPPTGLQLFWLFPPPPPSHPELRGGPTTCFRQQERAFFAQPDRPGAGYASRPSTAVMAPAPMEAPCSWAPPSALVYAPPTRVIGPSMFVPGGYHGAPSSQQEGPWHGQHRKGKRASRIRKPYDSSPSEQRFPKP